MFCFEDFNGFIKSHIKGPNGPIIQVLRKYFFHKACMFFDTKKISLNASEFYRDIFHKSTGAVNKMVNYVVPDKFQYLMKPNRKFFSLPSVLYKGWKYRPLNNDILKSFDSLIYVKSKENEYFGIIKKILIDDSKDQEILFYVMKQNYIKKGFNHFQKENSNIEEIVQLSDIIDLKKCVKTGKSSCSILLDVVMKD